MALGRMRDSTPHMPFLRRTAPAGSARRGLKAAVRGWLVEWKGRIGIQCPWATSTCLAILGALALVVWEDWAARCSIPGPEAVDAGGRNP